MFSTAGGDVRGGAFEPLSEEERAHIQQMVGDYHRLFVADLARAYGTSTQRIESDFGGGWALTAQRAVKAKMVSRIATLEQVLAEYGVTRQPATGARALAPEQMAASSLAALGGWNAEWAPLARDVRTRVAVSVPAGLNGADVETIAAAVREASQTKMLAAGAEEGETCGECGEPLEDDGADGTFCPVCEPEIEGKEQASAGGAASANTNTPATEPAPEAKETTVSETATGPQAGAVNEALDTANAILSFADSLGYPAAQARDLAFKPGITTSSAHNILVTWKAEQQKGSTVTVTDVRDRDERPFASLGQQLIAVRAADMRSASEEQVNRLNAVNKIVAAASGTDSRVPADGGWAIMPQIAEGIVKKGWEEGKVLSRINVIPIGEGSNSLIRNQLKETSRTTGSRYGGVRIYRTSEASTVEGSKPAMRRQTILLEKLMGIYYATEEMLNDAAALSAEAEVGFQKELTFVKEDEVFRGKGNGQALGFLESDALVTVAKEAGQAAATVKAENVAKMMARLPASSFATAVWYINPSVLPQLVQMTIGNQPVFIPGGNLAGAPFGTLFGIPIEMAEYCSALGTVGDIVLVDLSQWTGITKGGANWQSSLHVRFLYDETAFKLTDRFNGQPDWEQAVTPFKGADTISPFIALATRA